MKSSVLEFLPGDIILKEGEQSHDFCILLKGAARIDETGALIGGLALLNGEARSATVEGLTHGFCLRVESGFLDRLSPEQRKLSGRI